MTTGSFKIVPMVQTDRSAVLGLFASRAEYFTPPTLLFIDRCLEVHSGYYVHLAIADQRIVGCVIWREAVVDAEIYWLVVAADQERQGIGRALVEDVVARCSDKRFLFLKTAMSDADQAGKNCFYAAKHAFYGRCGFTQGAILPAYWPDGNDAVLFTRRLD